MYKPRKRDDIWIWQARDGFYYAQRTWWKAALGIVSPSLGVMYSNAQLKQLYFSKERR